MFGSRHIRSFWVMDQLLLAKNVVLCGGFYVICVGQYFSGESGDYIHHVIFLP